MVSEAARPPNGMLCSLLSGAACYGTKYSSVAGLNNCLVSVILDVKPQKTFTMSIDGSFNEGYSRDFRYEKVGSKNLLR